MAKKIKLFTVWFIIAAIALLISNLACGSGLNKNTFVISGTFLEVISSDKAAAGIVYQEWRRLDKIFNRYDEHSEITKINNSFNEPVVVSAEMIELLKSAREFYSLTQGVFDISQGKLYEFWKGKTKANQVSFPEQEEVADLINISGLDGLEIDDKQSSVIIKSRSINLDVSGIAKGYIVDKAVERLKKEGIESAVVNAGGDIYCLGSYRGKSWQVGIQDPNKADKVVSRKKLKNQAIATSGTYEQFFDYKGGRYSHLVDPRSGFPVSNDLVSVTVVSKSCMISDVLATAFLISGKEAALSLIREIDYPVEAFILRVDGKQEKL
ncbi:MAG: FAD:protein FMN transferase [Candidatus Omnitrophica bacterium]|nr:FAD:protein FMN transferase [Candidatus Omnitrophota bacterium]